MNFLSSYIFEQQSAHERFGRSICETPAQWNSRRKAYKTHKSHFIWHFYDRIGTVFPSKSLLPDRDKPCVDVPCQSIFVSRCRLHNVLYTQFGNGGEKKTILAKRASSSSFSFSFLFLLQPEFGECLLFWDLNKKWQFYLLALVQMNTLRSPETFRFIQSLIYAFHKNGSNAIRKINRRSKKKKRDQCRTNLLQINHEILALALRRAIVR